MTEAAEILPAIPEPDQVDTLLPAHEPLVEALAAAITIIDAMRVDASIIDDNGGLRGLPLARRLLPMLEQIRDDGAILHKACRLVIERHLRATRATATIIGGRAFTFQPKPGPYVYTDAAALRNALQKVVGSLLTQDELDRAVPQIVEPERVIPASTRTETDGGKLAVLAKRSAELLKIIDAFRWRDPGEAVLKPK